MIRERLFVYCSLALCFWLVGCSHSAPKDWTATTEYGNLVWADDSSEVAFIQQSYEEKQSGLFGQKTDKRNVKHQILIQKPTGNEPKAVTAWRNGPMGQHLFYMKQAGYLVADLLQENDTRRFDKVGLDGKEIPIVEEQAPYQPCTAADKETTAQISHSVIPSPDGLLLLEAYSPSCGKATVEFLYANNLNFIDGQTFNIDEPMTVLWHPEGYVIFTTPALDKAWKVTPYTPPVPIQPPRCLTPITTSSPTSLDGRQASFNADNQLHIEMHSRDNAFGCQ